MARDRRHPVLQEQFFLLETLLLELFLLRQTGLGRQDRKPLLVVTVLLVKAAKLRVGAAIFNDAGVGRDDAGIAGLDYLEALGIPAAAVGNDTARIGDGSDMMARGVITHAKP